MEVEIYRVINYYYVTCCVLYSFLLMCMNMQGFCWSKEYFSSVFFAINMNMVFLLLSSLLFFQQDKVNIMQEFIFVTSASPS